MSNIVDLDEKRREVNPPEEPLPKIPREKPTAELLLGLGTFVFMAAIISTWVYAVLS